MLNDFNAEIIEGAENLKCTCSLCGGQQGLSLVHLLIVKEGIKANPINYLHITKHALGRQRRKLPTSLLLPCSQSRQATPATKSLGLLDADRGVSVTQRPQSVFPNLPQKERKSHAQRSNLLWFLCSCNSLLGRRFQMITTWKEHSCGERGLVPHTCSA